MPRVSLSLWNKSTARSAIDTIIEAEAMGIEALWTDVGRSTPDPVTFFAAALWETSSIDLGIGIVPTFPRHPAVLANQHSWPRPGVLLRASPEQSGAPSKSTIGVRYSSPPMISHGPIIQPMSVNQKNGSPARALNA